MVIRERARPLPADERRAALLAAARPLVLEHGRATTTKLIAEAAGVAEGTIFRIFSTKDELFDAVIDLEFDPEPFIAALGRIDLDQPLETRLVEAVSMLQRRFVRIFRLLIALGVRRPPDRLGTPELRKRFAKEGLVRLVEPDADRFRIPPEEVVQLLRLLTFSGSHPHISDQRMLTAEQIVDVVLHGTLRQHDGEDS
ncbi:MAG TPA: TetR/AcrR family transcriptional regulator [Marmoricola sp.]|jgi:AcrR family transcriptional regulator|nr:TetR/AcrR family transcriptional regulator [Marmoricola sp.]